MEYFLPSIGFIFCLQNLPHDAYKLLAVPSPIGGVLVLSANTIHYHSQVNLFIALAVHLLGSVWVLNFLLSAIWLVIIFLGQSASCMLALNNFAVSIGSRSVLSVQVLLLQFIWYLTTTTYLFFHRLLEFHMTANCILQLVSFCWSCSVMLIEIASCRSWLENLSFPIWFHCVALLVHAYMYELSLLYRSDIL